MGRLTLLKHLSRWSWQSTSRIETRIAWTLLIAAALPVLLVANVILDELADGAERTAKANLDFLSKEYGQRIVQRIDFVTEELRILARSDDSALPQEAFVVNYRQSINREGLTRPRLRLVDGGLKLEVPLEDRLAVGVLANARLLGDLDDVPHGLVRCIALGVQDPICPTPVGVDAVTVSAPLFLRERYDVDFAVVVSTSQARDLILQDSGLLSRVLPSVIVVSAALACWLVLLLLRQQLAPLHELGVSADALAAGDYDKRVSLRTGDEFEHLGERFNLMADNVQSTLR